MGEIADMMVDGGMCSWCGVVFRKDYGYPCVSLVGRTPHQKNERDFRKGNDMDKLIEKLDSGFYNYDDIQEAINKLKALKAENEDLKRIVENGCRDEDTRCPHEKDDFKAENERLRDELGNWRYELAYCSMEEMPTDDEAVIPTPKGVKKFIDELLEEKTRLKHILTARHRTPRK